MVFYKFVHFPKEVKFAEVREELLKRIDCQIKNACPGGLFIRYSEGTIESFEIEQSTIDVAESRSVNDSNWDTLKLPRFLYQRRFNNVERKTEDGAESAEPRQPREPRAPRAPRTINRDSTAVEGGAPRPPPVQRDIYRAFAYSESVKPDDILAYFRSTLNTQVQSIEVFEGKMHYYLTFKTLDECRAARTAFKEQPLEGVTVKPYMTRAMKARRPLQRKD